MNNLPPLAALGRFAEMREEQMQNFKRLIGALPLPALFLMPVMALGQDPAGPWPIDNRTYTAADGILETPIVGTTTDETQNLWVATNDALYLLKPGDATFQRYAAADGLHFQSNPVSYCDRYLGGGDHACPIFGGAAAWGISEIVGGGSNEVFIGYYGNDDGTQDWFDPNRHTGKVDRVHLNPDGSLQVDRFDLLLV
ncbi:MAG TPA: hypothetical protein VEM39_12265, partial [Myxococcaceae bacterium]|nr:hypothetical protein [Myxococcaceae bacterium]